jgi:hypothetical protein
MERWIRRIGLAGEREGNVFGDQDNLARRRIVSRTLDVKRHDREDENAYDESNGEHLGSVFFD